jgi:hypothetical protein
MVASYWFSAVNFVPTQVLVMLRFFSLSAYFREGRWVG